ncbi:hypothetical protein RHMOL_Rhmol04G0021400 [Rhododendron molle]|uniref:Uncharacterized protein n=1 Tax=Rhododendron molle TaxID=49168 RepID=A0ACC0NXE5_RHOML|nr:hypothetical protein RHMOL_Rhmol04G0021400 [Rhododendron molle]
MKIFTKSELYAIWKNICPPKAKLFAWMAIQSCIASKSVLVSRGILNNNIDLCPLCNLEGETSNHLPLLCQYAWQTWTAIIQWWKLVWVSPPSLMAFVSMLEP